jgi:hypothetical protein
VQSHVVVGDAVLLLTSTPAIAASAEPMMKVAE